MDKDVKKINEKELDVVTGGIIMSAGSGGSIMVGEIQFYNIKDMNEAQNYLINCGILPRDQQFKDYMAEWVERNARKGGGVSGSW